MSDHDGHTIDVGEVTVGEPEAERTEVEVTDPVAFLRDKNQETITGLNREGIGIDPTVFIGLAVDTMLNLMWPEGSPLRHLYEVQYNMNLAQFLEERAQVARQAKLLEGVAGANPTPPQGGFTP